MKPTPQRLALLISLIGAGLSQDVRARPEDSLAADPTLRAQPALARGWAGADGFGASRLAALSAIDRWPDAAAASPTAPVAPQPQAPPPAPPKDEPRGPTAARNAPDPTQRAAHAPTELALVDDAPPDDEPDAVPDAASEAEAPPWRSPPAARMQFGVARDAETQDLAAVLLADVQLPVDDRWSRGDLPAITHARVDRPEAAAPAVARPERAVAHVPAPLPDAANRARADAAPEPTHATRPEATPLAAAPAEADPADTVLSTLAAVLSEHWTGPSHAAAAVDRRVANAAPKTPVTRAPSQAERVLGTLSDVLAAAPEDADRDLASTLAVDVELELDAAHLDLELDTAHVELELEAPVPRRSPFGDTTVAVDANRLADMRGGFTTNDGLRISFGIERAVYVNGNLVTTTSLNLSELGKVSGGQGQGLAMPTGSVTLIQNGAGNSVSLGPLSPSTIGTVIQNTLNDQKINAVTVVNATVNSLGVLKSMQMQTNLRNAIVDSLRR